MGNPLDGPLHHPSIRDALIRNLTAADTTDPEQIADDVLGLLSPPVSMALAMGNAEEIDADVPVHRWVDVICREYCRGILTRLSPEHSPTMIEELAVRVADEFSGHLFADLFARWPPSPNPSPTPTGAATPSGISPMRSEPVRDRPLDAVYGVCDPSTPTPMGVLFIPWR